MGAYGQLTALWLEGKLVFHPGYCGPAVEQETDSMMVSYLARWNRSGQIITESSQAGDPTGSPSGPVEANVYGFCSPLMGSALLADADALGLSVAVSSVKCAIGEKVVLVAGPAPSRADLMGSMLNPNGRGPRRFRRWRPMCFFYVTDPIAGRNDHLWSTFDGVVSRVAVR